MKKIMLVLVALLLAAFPATVYAGDNNPNSFELELHCGGEIIHADIPTITSNGGHTDDGRIGHVRSHKIDFEPDGIWDIEIVFAQGQGFDTVFCTWTWDRDPYLHGMDIQFSPTK